MRNYHIIYRTCRASLELIVVIFVSFLTSSCAASFNGQPDRTILDTQLKQHFQNGFSTQRLTEYRSAVGSDRSKLRNSIVLNAMGVIDLEYTRFERQLTNERQGVPFLASTTSLALSATSTVVGDAGTKAGLAAADTFLKGTKEAYDKEILANQTIGFLQAQMRANRNTVRSRILGLLSEPDEVYPLELALGDVEEYYSAGTVTSGLIGINARTAEGLTVSDASRVTTINRYQASSSSDVIRRALVAGGPPAVAKLEAWLRQRNVNVPVGIFLNSSKYTSLQNEYALRL